MTRRVAVTGGSVLSALGQNWPDIRSRLLSVSNCVRYMPEWEKYHDMQTRVASPIDHFELPPSYSKRRLRGMGRVAQFGVRSAELALTDAGLLGDEVLKTGRVGVAYGSASGSSEAAMEFFGLLDSHSMDKVNATSYLRMMSHTAAVNISVFFGTTGRVYTTSSACTSGSQAIGYAYECIRNGQQDVMIAGSAEALCPTHAAVFNCVYSASTKNETPQDTPSPFDRDRDGLVLGEGAGALILEDWEHAHKRGANIVAELIGYGTNSDGSHLVRPNHKTMASVIELGLKDAQLQASDIGYVSAHGTATVQGDLAESKATHNTLGTTVPISTLKSYVGHSLGACASMEAWLGIKMMNENWFAPTLSLEHIDEDCAPLNHIRNQPIDLTVDYFMSNNFAFGGINTSLVFKRIAGDWFLKS